MPVKAVLKQCSICGEPFGRLRHRDLTDRNRCMPCARHIRRDRKRQAYQEAKAGRRGKRVFAVMTQDEMAERIAEHYAQEPEAIAALARTLPRVCEFCCHHDDSLSAIWSGETCGLDLEPGESGGCPQWSARYRIEDDE